jgi:hypothetical protein
LSWIGHLILKHLDELVEEDSDKRPENWPDP